MPQQSPTLIRPFTTRDAAACVSLIASALPTMQGLNQAAIDFILGKNTPDNLGKELAALYCLVYEQEGTILGMGALKEQEITRVYVDPAAQGSGIGSALMTALEQEARQRGITTISVEASLNAEQFYKARGYCSVVPQVFTKGDAVLETILMKKQIS